jgi:ATP-dependent Clp protease protease subunit
MSDKLRQLLANNARPHNALPSIRADASGDVAHVYVYDVIDGYWGASATALVEALNAVRGKPVSLHINSPGGDVFEARAMVAALRAHDQPITAYVDGLAASSASWLALAASAVHIQDGGMFMVHNSWSWTWGNKHELRTTADLLDKIDGTIAQDYTRKTGADNATVVAWMDNETWFTAQEALEAKLVDHIITQPTQADGAGSNRWNLAAYSNAPKPPKPPEPSPQDVAAQAERQQRLNRSRLALLNISI